jgi:uncharacterized protein
MNRIIIYHSGCADGFCAAWLLWRQFPDAEFVPANYGDTPPDVTGKTCYVVDFSYPRDVLEEMNGKSEMLVVLDHHKTAQAALDGLPYCRFDMKKSGARLTWEYIQTSIKQDRVTQCGEQPPWLVAYTEDRDLWKWELDQSREVNACLRSYGFDFEVWNKLHDGYVFDLAMQGAAILRDQALTVKAKAEQAHMVTVAGVDHSRWKVANATTLISETAGELAKETMVGCCWFEMGDGSRVYSLRTCTESNVDCSAMAKHFGGGGHPGAAGFKLAAGVPHPWATTT